MSVQIDLMPAICRQSLGRRARVRKWVFAYVVAVLIVGAGYASVVAGDSGRRNERALLEREVRTKWERNEEAQAILTEIKNLEATIARHQRLAWPIHTSNVIAVIGSKMPESVTLTCLTVTPKQERVRAVNRGKLDRSGKTQSGEPPKVTLAIEIEGVAHDDNQLSHLVMGLEESQLFTNVALDFARSRDVDGVDARAFRVTCGVDMSLPYEFVSAEPTEATNAD